MRSRALRAMSTMALLSCGAPDAARTSESPKTTPGASGSPSSGATQPVPEMGGTLTLGDASAPPSAPDPAGDALAACALETQQAERSPLDLDFIVDVSGSMDDLVAPLRSKWQAVSAAIRTFVNDPASAGIGMGLQYFPLFAKGFPSSCTKSSQCGSQGLCFMRVCYDSTDAFCSSDEDCPSHVCGPLGSCANNPNDLCNPGGSCGDDSNGFDLGDCLALTLSTCAGSDDCSEADYATPAVSIASLPGVASEVTSSLEANAPHGSTPTQAALTGAMQGAVAYASANAGHTVVVVLATDGLPDEIAAQDGTCTRATSQESADEMVAQAAATGLSSTPSVKTFAIGVFAPDDAPSGTTALDAVAGAGGTGQPFVIQTAAAMSDTEEQFVDALNAIRGASLPCSYEVPVPSSGTPDYFEVNVRYTSGSGVATTEPYVEGASACDPTAGGWYYDVDPSEGGIPVSIDMCPATCSTVKDDSMGRVDIVVGCETQTRIH